MTKFSKLGLFSFTLLAAVGFSSTVEAQSTDIAALRSRAESCEREKLQLGRELQRLDKLNAQAGDGLEAKEKSKRRTEAKLSRAEMDAANARDENQSLRQENERLNRDLEALREKTERVPYVSDIELSHK